MKRLLTSVVFIILLGVSSSAQGLYKIQYSDRRSNVFDALLAWYGPFQPSVLRIKYYDPGSRSNVLVEEQVAFMPGPHGFTLRGYNPRFISPAPAGQSYSPDSFIFHTCPNGSFPCVTAVDDAGNLSSAVSEFRELQPNETAAFLKAFGYSTPDTDYIAPQNVTLHLIIAADTNAEDIGRGNEIDARALAREFEVAAREIGVAFKLTLLSGGQFSKGAVVAALNNLSPGPNDVVIFVYTGHGYRLLGDSDQFPRLNFSRNRHAPGTNYLAASEVFNILKGKRSRLNITLVDACNDSLSEDKLRYESGFSLKSSESGISGRATAELLLNARANILVAAAGIGEQAKTNETKGALFIRSFLDAFRAETSLVNSSSPSWRRIIASARDSAYRLSRGKQNAISVVE